MTTISLLTHNYHITMYNSETGQHRTIRIRTETWADKSEHRVAALLHSGDDWRSFGFVKVNQQNEAFIVPWKKYRGTKFEVFAKMISRPSDFEKRGIEYLLEGRCRRCNRVLTHPDSIKSGIGPICKGIA